MESVILSRRYVHLAFRLACERVRGKRDDVIADPDDYSGPSVAERHFIGLLAELAFAEYFELQVNTETEKTDPGYDFDVELDGERLTLDVKGYTHKHPRLLVTEGTVKADYYVHCRVNLRSDSVNCAREEYRIVPNKIARQRQEQAPEGDDITGVSLGDSVVVDLLGVATKEMVLEAPVIRHASDPSHTR